MVGFVAKTNNIYILINLLQKKQLNEQLLNVSFELIVQKIDRYMDELAQA